MASKSSLNDYSAFGNLFRDGLIGVLISTGVLSTLVPNLIESIGKVKELNSFYTLNLFSVIYFIFPITIFTTYWLIRGSRLFFIEKLSMHETINWKEIDSKVLNENEWVKFFVALAKLLPVILFVYDESIFAGSIWLLFYYLLVCVIQLFLNQQLNVRWIRRVVQSKERRNHLQYRAYCIDALVFFLDFILGVCLVVFSTPWVIYSNHFYLFISLAIVLYAIISWGYSIHRFENSHFSIHDFIVCILLSVAGLGFPAVNMRNYDEALWATLFLYLAVGSWWTILAVRKIRSVAAKEELSTMKAPSEGLTEVRKRNFNRSESKTQSTRREAFVVVVLAITVFVVAGLVVHFVLFKGNEKSNLIYLKNRFTAAQQISDKEVYPFVDPSRRMEIHLENTYNSTYSRDELKRRLKLNKLGLDTVHLRYTFYREYVSLENNVGRYVNAFRSFDDKIDSLYDCQDSIDVFYSRTYEAVSDVGVSERRNEIRQLKRPQERRLERYLHPLDYMSSYLERQMRLWKNSDNMLRTCEGLMRIALLKKNAQSKVYSSSEVIYPSSAALIGKLDSLYRTSVELRFDKSTINTESDSAQLARLIRFHKIYFEYREAEYIKAYEGTQKVYRSYLVDSQRVGVWAFLITVLVLALASYLNGFGSGSLKLSRDREDLPLDSPRHALPIMMLAVLILLMPLMKPIEPQHIDPEKPYWMVSLQNWHTPSFVKALTDRDDGMHYKPGGAHVTVPVNVDMEKVRESLDQLKTEMEKNREVFNHIEKDLDSLRILKEMSDDILWQKKPRSVKP